MTPDDIGKAYNQITHLWDNDRFDKNNGIAQHLRALTWLVQKRKALDVGCGCTGRFTDLLLSEGLSPDGLDISEKKLALVCQKFPQLKFYLADICEWEIPEQYDFITAWDSIWHVPLSQQEAVVTKLINALAPGGVLIFSFGGTETASDHTDNAMGPLMYYSTLGTRGYLRLVEKMGCECRHLEYDQHPLHAYMIVQKPA